MLSYEANLLSAGMMTSKISLTVALAAGLLLLSLTDAKPAESADAGGGDDDVGTYISAFFDGLRNFINEGFSFPVVTNEDVESAASKAKADEQEMDKIWSEVAAELQRQIQAFDKIYADADVKIMDQANSEAGPAKELYDEIDKSISDEIEKESEAEQEISDEIDSLVNAEIESEMKAESEMVEEAEKEEKAE